MMMMLHTRETSVHTRTEALGTHTRTHTHTRGERRRESCTQTGKYVHVRVSGHTHSQQSKHENNRKKNKEDFPRSGYCWSLSAIEKGGTQQEVQGEMRGKTRCEKRMKTDSDVGMYVFLSVQRQAQDDEGCSRKERPGALTLLSSYSLGA